MRRSFPAYSFAADRETLLADLSTEGTDERDPSVWRGDIAFVRATASKQHLVVGNTTSTGAPRTLVSRRASTGSILDPALSAGRVAYLATTREDAYGLDGRPCPPYLVPSPSPWRCRRPPHSFSTGLRARLLVP